LVPKKNVPFYAIWVGKFLSFLNMNLNIKEKSTLPAFIEQLKNQGNVKDWQLKQAEAAMCGVITSVKKRLKSLSPEPLRRQVSLSMQLFIRFVTASPPIC
jgi:hypothetical protein